VKSRRDFIKTRSTPATLPLIGQITKHITVKWTIQLSDKIGLAFDVSLLAIHI